LSHAAELGFGSLLGGCDQSGSCLVFSCGGQHTATWVFKLQATGLPSTAAIDPPVAVLVGTELASGVQFFLNPDETSGGYIGNPTTSFIES
jgi:hypothetical protein